MLSLLGGPPPTLERLIKHAERYGTAFVVQTAVEYGYSIEDCTRLQVRCDVIEKQQAEKERWGHYTKPRHTAEERVMKLMGIKKEKNDGDSSGDS